MRFILLSVLCFLFANQLAFANDKAGVDTEMLNVQYSKINHASMSNLLVRFGDYDLSDNETLDDYLAITNCSLYSKYYENDFLWQRIRTGARRQLEYYASQFPDRYEIISRIDLGRYDFSQGSFILPDDSSLNNVAYFSLSSISSSNGVCGREINKLPTFYTAMLRSPINLKSIPVPADKAREIIEANIQRGEQTRRMAVLRLRMKFLGVDPKPKDENALFIEGAFAAEIDSIAIYRTSRMDDLIYQRDFKNFED